MNGRLRDENTVQLHVRPGRPAGSPADDVTVCVAGASLAPAPSALVTRAVKLDVAPVFVDDSGTRKMLLRLVGVVVAVLSVGFLSLVGVALAVPSVATSVGLDGAVPFLVPGAAAKPPPAPPVVVAPVVKPRVFTPKPRVTVAPKPRTVAPKPKAVAPVAKPKPAPAPESKAPESKAPEAPQTAPTSGDTTTGDTDAPAEVDAAPAAGHNAPAGQAPAQASQNG